MISAYRSLDGHLEEVTVAGGAFPPDTVWIDCLRPTREEDAAAEAFVGVGLPTREEMQEIEPSSRLAVEDGALYLTASILCGSQSSAPRTSAVTFVLTARHLATVRYEEPGMLAIARARLARPGEAGALDAAGVLCVLLEAAIDRLADVIEQTGAHIDAVGRHIFGAGIESADGRGADHDHKATLANIGQERFRLDYVGESLISLSRLLIFLDEKCTTRGLPADIRGRIATMKRDVDALSVHVQGLGDRLTFMLDATLGLISIQQNGIIKIFSVLAVVLMPPTLVASLYGMNFRLMPELDWTYGYPMALAMMVASAVVTWSIFRWKRWL